MPIDVTCLRICVPPAIKFLASFFKVLHHFIGEHKVIEFLNAGIHDFIIGTFPKFLYKGKKLWEGSNNEIMNSGVEELDDFVFSNKVMQNLKERS